MHQRVVNGGEKESACVCVCAFVCICVCVCMCVCLCKREIVRYRELNLNCKYIKGRIEGITLLKKKESQIKKK